MQCVIKNLTISPSGISINHKKTFIKIAINCDKSWIEENLQLHNSTFGTPQLKE